ncbi:MAG: hypothetical protein IH612_01545, partial [Desulfofustis sp.]|nr:hypothetical protein [Desulfofustis sp.]
MSVKQILGTYHLVGTTSETMDNQETESGGKRRLKKKSVNRFLLPLILFILFILGGYFLFFSESAQKLRPASPPSVSEESLNTPAPPGAPSTGALVKNEAPPTIAEKSNQVIEATISASSSDSEGAVSSADAKPKTPATSAEQATVVSEQEKECQTRGDSVAQFFDLLDTREYLQAFVIEEKSRVYFPRLIQKLVDNPPIVSGETDDLFTILQNTAHFFRIIGKKNILILKGILDREKDTFEQTLSDFYELTKQPDCLKKRFGLTIGKEPLYRYAGFFINTMGGRLYLFRRDSMSRMVVGFYGILVIDQANREGRNSYGIEIKTSINRLIEEMESSNIKLRMRDRYLDTL